MNHVINLAEAATVAARLLHDHPDMPRVVALDARRSLYSDDVDACLQLEASSGLTGLVTAVTDWAHALNTTVTLSVAGTFTQIAAEVRIDGHTVQVWDHLTPADTATVFTGLGMPLPTRGTHVEVSPAALLRTVATVAAVA